jgi:hypothetical protein
LIVNYLLLQKLTDHTQAKSSESNPKDEQLPISELDIYKMADQTFHSQPNLEDEPEFTFFPKPPTELRDMIWLLAIPGSRIISMMLESPEASPQGPVGVRAEAERRKVPALLHTSQEARTFPMKTLRLAFNDATHQQTHLRRLRRRHTNNTVMTCGVNIRRSLADFHDLTDHAASIERELRRVVIESPLGSYGVLFL